MFYISSPDKTFKDKRFGWRRFIYGGLFFKSWGAYPLLPQQQDYAKSLREHEELLNDGASVCVFPTGSIATEGAERHARGGIGYLAKATKAIIVPVHIERDSYASITPPSFLARTHHFTLEYRAPIMFEDLLHDPEIDDVRKYQSIARQIMEFSDKTAV